MLYIFHAGMAELVDAHDSKSCVAIHESSILSPGTMKKPVIVICGPTATGKSALAVEVAKIVNGEIISADSRQVYTGLDIGSGKITEEEMQDIPHYGIDIAEPGERFSASEFLDYGFPIIADIHKRNKIPIICGGSGMYIDTLLQRISIPSVAPNEILRSELEMLSAEELFKRLQKLDRRTADRIDRHNKRRLVRAIEIVDQLGAVPLSTPESIYDVLYIGIDYEDEILKERINTRLKTRLDQGMIDEVQGLIDQGVSTEWLIGLGLEYKYCTECILGNIPKDTLEMELRFKIHQYAKRQRTWFKRNTDIRWFIPPQKEDIKTYCAQWLEALG